MAGVSSLMFATTDSVVKRVAATLVAFCSALLVTLAGSTNTCGDHFYILLIAVHRSRIRAWILLPCLRLRSLPGRHLLRSGTEELPEPSVPALHRSSRHLPGRQPASQLLLPHECKQNRRLQMIPSSTAALVAASASSIRSFASFISVSVAAPTRITATPPESFARRS